MVDQDIAEENSPVIILQEVLRGTGVPPVAAGGGSDNVMLANNADRAVRLKAPQVDFMRTEKASLLSHK